jgi:Spy/CpxP family protein refolding chaperone
MQKWKIIAGLLLVFVLGALTGALGTGMVLKRHHPFFSHQPEGRKTFIMKRLSRKLDLSAEQKVRIEAIIDRVQAETFQKMREGRRFMREHLEKGFAEIRKELTPEQQRRFDQMRAERERRRKERGERFQGPWRPEDDT